MENFNPDLQKKNQFKKRKLFQQVDSNMDKHIYGFVSETGDILENQKKKADQLLEKLMLSQEKLYERQELVLEQTKKMKDLSSEIERLQNLLYQKNEATIRVEMMRKEPPKAIILEENNASQKELIDVRSKETPKAIVLEEDNASQKELIDQSSCRCVSNVHGDQIVTDSISGILRTLIEGVLGMKVSFGPQSAEVIHEKSGYRFSLAWTPSGDELVYRVSSLGTLDDIACYWMREEITFSAAMCPKFFEKIWGIIGRA